MRWPLLTLSKQLLLHRVLTKQTESVSSSMWLPHPVFWILFKGHRSMSFTEIFLRILIVMWFPVWTMQQRAQEWLTRRLPPSQLNYRSHIQRGVSGKCSEKPPFPHGNQNLYLSFLLKTTLLWAWMWTWAENMFMFLLICGGWMHFLVYFPSTEENKLGSDRGTVSPGSRNNVPWPSITLHPFRLRCPCTFHFGVGIEEIRPTKNGLREGKCWESWLSEGSSPTLEP